MEMNIQRRLLGEGLPGGGVTQSCRSLEWNSLRDGRLWPIMQSRRLWKVAFENARRHDEHVEGARVTMFA
jgi:hypothetical protein